VYVVDARRLDVKGRNNERTGKRFDGAQVVDDAEDDGGNHARTAVAFAAVQVHDLARVQVRHNVDGL
jgi:hypothetical protein